MKYRKTLGTAISLLAAPFLYFAQPAKADTFDKVVSKSNKEFQQSLQKSNKEFDERLQQSNKDFEQGLQKSEQEFQKKLEQSDKQYQEQLQKSEKEFDEHLEKSNKEFEQALKKSNLRFKQGLENTRKRFDEKIYNFHKESQDEISDLEKKINTKPLPETFYYNNNRYTRVPLKRLTKPVRKKTTIRTRPNNRTNSTKNRNTTTRTNRYNLQQQFKKFKQSLDTILDNDVKPLFSTEEAYSYFTQPRVGEKNKVEFAKQVHDKYSKVWANKMHQGFPLFSAEDIIQLYNLGNVDDFFAHTDKLLEYRPEQNQGNPFFHDGEQIIRSYLNKMPEEFIDGWMKVMDRLNFDCKFLNTAWESGLHADSYLVTKALALGDDNGSPLYNRYNKDAQSLLELHQLGAKADIFDFFSQFKSDKGYFLFRPQRIKEIVKKGFDLDDDYIKQLLELEQRNKEKLTIGDIESAAVIKSMNNPNYVSSLYKIFKEQGIDYKLSLAKIKRYCQLNLPLRDIFFYDTRKPNAVIVLPTSDHNEAFYGESGRDFIKSLLRQYDAQIIIADTEQDVYTGLDYVPDVLLTTISGHGTQKTLSLGEADLRIYTGSGDETRTIDTSDVELLSYLKKTHPRSVVLLRSCLNGKGRQYEENLANFTAKSGRKVISGDDIANRTEITSLFPFDAEVYHHDKETGRYRRITYKPEIGGKIQ